MKDGETQRLSSLIRLMSSDNDAEAVNALRFVQRSLSRNNLDLLTIVMSHLSCDVDGNPSTIRKFSHPNKPAPQPQSQPRDAEQDKRWEEAMKHRAERMMRERSERRKNSV